MNTIIIDKTLYNWHEIDPGRAQRAHVIDKTIDQMRARIRKMEEEKRALVDGTRAKLGVPRGTPEET